MLGILFRLLEPAALRYGGFWFVSKALVFILMRCLVSTFVVIDYRLNFLSFPFLIWHLIDQTIRRIRVRLLVASLERTRLAAVGLPLHMRLATVTATSWPTRIPFRAR